MKLSFRQAVVRVKYRCNTCSGTGVIANSYRGDQLKCMHCQGTGYQHRPRIMKKL